MIMNEFTKDELELLRDGLNYGVSNPYGFTVDTVMPLYNKLKSMIDNYCEHDHSRSGFGIPVICDDCNEVIG
jgi:hypothetical protein